MKSKYILLSLNIIMFCLLFTVFLLNFLSLFFSINYIFLVSITITFIFIFSLLYLLCYFLSKNIISSSKLNNNSNISLFDEYQKTIDNLKQKNDYIINRYNRTQNIKEEYKKDMRKTRKMVLSLMPKALPLGHSMSFACTYSPLENIGGDFYDFVVLDNNKIIFIIADVTGHGVEAALVMPMLKITFNLFLKTTTSPSEILYKINNELKDILPKGYFVTATISFIVYTKKEMLYSSASHTPFFIKSAKTNEVLECDNSDTILGLFPNALYQEHIVLINDKDTVMFYTDGIIDASLSKNKYDLYGKNRLKGAFFKKSKNIKTTLDFVTKDFYDYLSYRIPDDDFTIILFKF